MATGERKAFLLRISPELWTELEAWAAEDFRSVNGQVEYLLSQAVNTRRRKSPKASEADTDKAPTS